MAEDQVLESEIQEAPEQENTSLREELTRALSESKEKAEAADAKEAPLKPAKSRAEDGKFAKSEKQAAPKPVAKPVTTQGEHKSFATTPAARLEATPRSYTNAVKAKWAELPEDVRQDLIKREREVELGFTKMDEERTFGRQMKDTINPYMPVIQSMGYEAPKVIQSLLNSAYVLKTGTPEQKLKHLRQIAESYGVDPRGLQIPATAISPEIASLQRELAQLKGERNQEVTFKQQQEKEVVNQTIREFAADTDAHPHFEAVRPRMAALLSANQAQNLQDAYEQAIYADPTIRSTLLESHTADMEAKRIAESKEKAAAARKAGSSLKGGPGVAVPNVNKPNLSLRDELRANLRAATQH